MLLSATNPSGPIVTKPRNSRRATIYEVSVFLFAVERQLRKWPEKSERETRWFKPEEASTLVAPVGLADILRNTARQLLVGPVQAEQPASSADTPLLR